MIQTLPVAVQLISSAPEQLSEPRDNDYVSWSVHSLLCSSLCGKQNNNQRSAWWTWVRAKGSRVVCMACVIRPQAGCPLHQLVSWSRAHHPSSWLVRLPLKLDPWEMLYEQSLLLKLSTTPSGRQDCACSEWLFFGSFLLL